MHYSAKRGRLLRPSVRLSVRPPVRLSVTLVDQDHIGQLAQHLRSSWPKGHPPNQRGTWGELGWSESGVLKHKSDNVSEMRKGRGKVAMHGVQELTNALLNRIPSRPPFPNFGGSQPPHKTPIPIILGTGEATVATDFKFGRHSLGSIHTKAH